MVVAVANDSSGAVVVLNERTTASLPFHAESTYFYAHKRSQAHLHTQRIQHSAQQQRQPLKNTRLSVHENARQGKATKNNIGNSERRRTANNSEQRRRRRRSFVKNGNVERRFCWLGLAWLYHIFYTSHRIGANARRDGGGAAQLATSHSSEDAFTS